VYGSSSHNGGMRDAGGERPLVAPFAAGNISDLRHRVAGFCARAGLAGEPLDDFVLAVYELLTNAVRHGGGSGRLRLWREGEGLVCEVRDIGDGFATAGGGPPPGVSSPGGLGIWLAGRLSHSMSVDSGAAGTTVRLRTGRRTG
jgi:serine/threonine-protein kinase RsbW